MGHWSTSILGNDTAADLKSKYGKLVAAGKGAREIHEEVERSFPSRNQQGGPIVGDNTDFWLSFAFLAWQHGHLTDELRAIARGIVERGDDLETWRDLGASAEDLADRKKVLDELLIQLDSPTPPPKPTPVQKVDSAEEPVLLPGDIFTFPVLMTNRDFIMGTFSGDEWGYGRVLFHPFAQCGASGREPTEVTGLSDHLWLELYRETSAYREIPEQLTPLLPCFETSPELDFEVVARQPVDPGQVVFRETVANITPSSGTLIIGEVRFDYAMQNGLMELEVYPGTRSGGGLGKILLVNTGRGGELELDNPDYFSREKIDLRFHPLREQLLVVAGLTPDYDYANLSREHGVDIARFFG